MANANLSEKVSVNINSSTLSEIDLLVDHGYYSNRSDFINQALRASLQQQQSTIDRIVEKSTSSAGSDGWFIGVSGLTNKEIDEHFEEGECFAVKGYGVYILPTDCDEQKLFSVISSITVRGKVVCSDSVKKHYGLK